MSATTISLALRGVYVTGSAGGFYYRQRAGTGARGVVYVPRPALRAPGPDVYATETIASAGVEQLSDLSQDQFVASLNEWTTRGALQIIALSVTVAALIAASALSLQATGELLIYGAIGTTLARFVEQRRRHFMLMMDLGPAETARFGRLNSALAALATSSSFRGITQIGHHADWKRNGGATRQLSVERAVLRQSMPPHIISNITPWMLTTQRLKLYFFPDRVLIYSCRKFAALSYSQLSVACDQERVVWDAVLPHDARVVGDTWLYVRRDGGPDNRFNNNRKIPLVMMARLTLSSQTGLDIVAQATKLMAAEQVAIEAKAYGSVAAMRVAPAALRGVSTPVANALTVLGLDALPTLDKLRKGYRELIARNQPAHIAPDSRELQAFAIHRLAELDAAYEVVRVQLGGNAHESDARALTPLVPAIQASRWMRADRMASAAAAAAALTLFVTFRVAGRPQASPSAAPTVTMHDPVAAPAIASPSMPPAPVVTRRVVIACPLRESPSSSARALAGIAGGTELALLDEQAGWRRVRDPNGREGWTGPKCWQPAAPAAARAQAPKPPAPSTVTASTPPPIEHRTPVDPYAPFGAESAGSAVTTSVPRSTANNELKQMLE